MSVCLRASAVCVYVRAFVSYTIFFKGLAAVQLGQVLGARVLAAASSDSKLQEIARITGLPQSQLINTTDLKKFKVCHLFLIFYLCAYVRVRVCARVSVRVRVLASACECVRLRVRARVRACVHD